MRQFLLFVFVFIGLTLNLYAQVTTSSLVGKVLDEKGEVLIGAAVKAIHVPTGTSYGVSTNIDGRFSISNMRVGGPYNITITYIGFQTQTRSNISLELGVPFLLNTVMKLGGTELAEVVIVSKKDPVLNSKRTGAATNISREQIENAPTISRSLQDFTRLTPQANGNSFGGVNNRFNNITIDGAVNNDVFGLAASGTPGGQAGTQPISLDAIQEIQVVLAPYDVTQGNFTGGGVNAVTRSGSNKLEGSVYVFGRNENTIGKNVLTNLKSPSFIDNQYGFRIGGPLVKNKLFFFLNAELQRRNAPTINNAGETGSAISLATAQAIEQKAQTTYGYDVGSIEIQDIKRENNKFFTKFDWNINDRNQLSLRYNYIDAFDDNITRSSAQFSFGNNAYKFKNVQHVGVVELRTKLSDKLSNNLILGYSRIRDHRVTAGALFPSIAITDGPSTTLAQLGAERSSVANELDQDIYEITNNFKIDAGKHTFTIGTHNEFFSFRNLFINNINGRWEYKTVADFITNDKPDRVRATYSLDPTDSRPAAKFSAAQLAFYAQDEMEVIERLKLTVGLRVDIPVFGSTPLQNPKIENTFNGYKTNNTPSTLPLVSPRLGFNYDVWGDRSMQIRGGAGVFTGRVPFVWLSNQFSNSGMLFGTIDQRNPSIFIADPNNQQAAGVGSTKSEVDLVSNNFRIPQVFRNNLAVDFKLPLDITGTLEGIYSKTINSVVYSDLNLKPSSRSISSSLTGGADRRAFYGSKVDATNFTNVILLDNINQGYTYSLTAQLQKNFSNGISAMCAYTNSEAQSINDGASSAALSNWEGVPQINGPNSPALTTSIFQVRHRLVGSLGYKIKYGKTKLLGTGISLFYSGRSGQPYSYTYMGDLNGDGSTFNDLIYVPRNASEITLVASGTTSPADQWTALDKYITNDSYLNSRRGQYAERNGAETSWMHQFDIRITQDIGFIVKGFKNKIQLTWDIINVGNLINKDWGRQYAVPFQSLPLITYTGAGYTFQEPTSTYQTLATDSAWSSQFGIRYIF